MVVFTCNNCGASLAKPKVAKHISFECKKKYVSVSLCCVDCLKDFNADTYVEHTKCVTELERYSGGNYVAKPSSNKGERKQNSWIDTVRSVLNNPSLSKQQTQLLNAIAHFENVPRKKAKFQNFIKSSLRTLRVYPDVVDSVFELIENEFKKSNIATTVPTNIKFVDKNGEVVKTNGTQSTSEELDNQNEVTTEKKNHDSDENQLVSNSKCNTELEIESNGIQKIKKKKKKNEITTENELDASMEDEKSDKNKKRKRISEAELNGVNSMNGTHCDDSQTIKKKKLKIEENDSVLHNTNGNHSLSQNCYNGEELNIETEKRKKKKKKVVHEEENQENIFDAEMKMECDEVNENEKKLKESGKNTVFQIEENNSVGNIENENELKLHKKKKKKVFQNQSDSTEVPNNCDDNNNDSQKKMKKKGSMKSNEKNNHEEEVKSCEGMEVDVNESVQNGNTRFNWEEIVTLILSTSTNNEIQTKKMIKKIVKKYNKFYEKDTSFDDIAKKFNKKVKKMTNVIVKEDRIQLCA